MRPPCYDSRNLMRTGALVKGVLVIAMIAGAWWFWSLGSSIAIASPEMVVAPEDGVVEIQQGGSAWKRITSRTSVAMSDRIRTSVNAHATIQFGQRAETRLAPETELRIQELSAKADGLQTMDVSLALDHGRVWSRVLRLFDVDSQFHVSHQNVIATVRGTSFDVSGFATGTTIWVAESAVELETPSSPTVGRSIPIVANGSMAVFDSRGGVSKLSPLSTEDRQSAWFQKNQSRDAALDERIRTQLRNVFESLQPAEPGSMKDLLSTWSEDVHVFVGGSRSPMLSGQSSARRLYAMLRAVEDGKEGLALQSLNRAVDGWLGKMKSSDPRTRDEVIRSLMDIQFLLQTIGSDSSVYRFKQRLEDVMIDLSGSDEIAKVYARLMAVDARIDEAQMLIDNRHLDEAKNASDAATSGLANIQKDTDRVDLVSERGSAIKSKIASLQARLTVVLSALQLAQTPVDTTSSTTSTVPVVTPTSTGMMATSSPITALTVTARSAPANVGVPVSFSVIAIHADQSRTDVTSQSQFTITPTGFGRSNGPIFVPVKAGQITVGAQYADGSGRFMGQTVLTILSANATTTTP